MILSLKAEKRSVVGRKVAKLRKTGLLPANIYGKKVTSEAISLDLKEFSKVYKDAGETGLIEVAVAGQKRPVLVHHVQLHPVTDEMLHVDFLQVDLKEKVTANVPLEVAGESPAEKQGLGTVVQYVNEIEVKSLPGDIPDKFEIDATTLKEVDQAILVGDLKYDTARVEVSLPKDQVLVKVEPPKVVEEEVVASQPTGEGVAEGASEVQGEDQASASGAKVDAPKEASKE